MRGWVRRHPFLSVIFVVYAAIFIVVAFADDNTSLPVLLVGLAILLVPAAFALWTIGAVIDLFKRALASRPSRDAVPRHAPGVALPAPAAERLDPGAIGDRRDLLHLDLPTWEALCLQGLRDLGFHGIERTGDRSRIGHTWLGTSPGGDRTFIFPRRFRTEQPIPRLGVEGVERRRGDHPAAGAIFMTTGLLAPPARDLAASRGIVVFDGTDMVGMATLVLPALPEVRAGEPIGFCDTCGAEKMTLGDNRCSVCDTPE